MCAQSFSLTKQQVLDFKKEGYLILPSFLPENLVNSLKAEVDRWVDQGFRQKSIAGCKEKHPPELMELELGEHGWLISYPPLMTILEQLMGTSFAFHHLHSDRHDSGCTHKNWHHDYEQYPQSNRSHAMVHVFHYLNGLDGAIADLVVVPRTQYEVMDKRALDCFGVDTLPHEIAINNLPAGTTVIAHSAIFHARRAKPFSMGKVPPRYFIDCSYCQVGVRWPQVKPYWRGMLAKARELKLDRGTWKDLFDEKHFYDPFEILPQFDQINQGSLIEKLIA